MLTLLALLAAPALQDPAPAPGPPAPPVVVVRFEGQLTEPWTSILRRAQAKAQEISAGSFVLELDTPGGEVELMKRLGDALVEIGNDIETVVFVTHRAWSAGSYLAIACDQVWMAPGSSLGAAMPITALPGGILPEMDPDVQEKILSAFRAEFRAWAEERGRDPIVAEAFVDNSVELKWVSVGGERRLVTGRDFQDLLDQGELPRLLETLCDAGELLALTPEEAREVEYCEGVAADRQALLNALGWDDRPVVEIAPSWSESLVSKIGSYSWLLMLAAAFFLVVSFNMPGMGAPEIAALLCLALFLFHGYLTGLAEWTDVLLVVMGLGLIFTEIFIVPGTIIAGAAGGLLLVAGLIMAMQDFVIPEGAIEMRTFRGNLMVVLAIVLVTPFLAMFAVRKLAKTRAGSFLTVEPSSDFAGSVAGSYPEATDKSDVEAGAAAVALTPLRPSGRVSVAGRAYDALSTGGFLDAGAQLRVVRRQGSTLLVAPAGAPSPEPQA